MSDIKFYDAAICWIEDGEPHATFHHTCKLGSRSLAIWRFANCMQCDCPSQECSACLPFLGKCFEGQESWACSWCGQDQHFCECEVDANGLVWSPDGLGIPFGDVDLPF